MSGGSAGVCYERNFGGGYESQLMAFQERRMAIDEPELRVVLFDLEAETAE
jgi:hypothetical protein